MSALPQPSSDSTVAAIALQPATDHPERLMPQSTVISLVAGERAAYATSASASHAPASTFVNAPLLAIAPAAPVSESPVTVQDAGGAAAQGPAAAPVADQKSLLQFVASTKPAEDAAPLAKVVATCVIPQAITFKGEAEFPCDAVIEGEFEGTLRVGPTARVSIAKAGMVEGQIHAHSVHVDGSVSGEVHAIGGLASFGHQAFCSGQIHYTRLAIEEGAEIEASMKRVPQAV